jgi:hypothetical protein
VFRNDPWASSVADVPTRRYDFVREIRNEDYRRLLSASVAFCDLAVLVVPSEPEHREWCAGTIEVLRPFLRVHEFRSEAWPGTISWGDPARIYWLDYSAEAAMALGTQVDGLYEWELNRERPEDLALLCEDGREFLASVAHERESWMWLTDNEYGELCEQVPGLVSLLGA